MTTIAAPAEALPLTPGYRADLASVRRLRADHEATADPASPTAASEVLTLRHREVMLAGGRPADLVALGAAVDAAVARFPTWPDLRLLRATVALALHQVGAARAALDALPGLVDQPPGRVLAADVAQFAGDYAGARTGYLSALRDDPLWATEARLAALALATGHVEEAEDRYAVAEDEITAKQMRAFAWMRVQRADLARALGQLDRAERYLHDAERGYPGWWYVAAHQAALDLHRGRPDAAVAGYRNVLAEVDRPEFREALGTALVAAGNRGEARTLHRSALAEYTASAARGEVHYLHHLAAYYADVDPDPEAAVAWARRDVRVRRNGSTLSLLAWCLHRAGHREDALRTAEQALSLGAGDPTLLARVRLLGRPRTRGGR